MKIPTIPIYPAKYQFKPSDVPPQSTWVEEMIPATGTVLLYGPSGVGKTTVMANMMNCIAQNQQFVGRNTTQCNAALLSMDMPRHEIIRRWRKAKFQQEFEFWPSSGFNCLADDFKQTDFYAQLHNRVKEKDIKLVVVDALRDVFHGDMINDECPGRVYQLFQDWFHGATIVFIHHTRKANYQNGKKVVGDIDDEATGSKYWVNKAQVTLSMQKLNADVLSLMMGKSQCFAQWHRPLRFEVTDMTVTEWTKAQEAMRAQQYKTTWDYCDQNDPSFGQMSAGDQAEVMAAYLKCHPRTVETMKAAYKKTIPER